MKKISRVFWSGGWRVWLAYVLGLIASAGLVFYRLGTLVPSAAKIEQPSQLQIVSLQAILNNPLNAPHKIIQYGLVKLGHSDIFALRSVSAALGLAVIILFYYIMRQWHTARIALLSTILFACSSWFLHIARLATPDIMQLLVIAFVAYGLWLISGQRRLLVLLVGNGLLAVSLYTPGLVWFILVSVIWQRGRLLYLHRKLRAYWLIPAYILALVLILPLLWGLANHPNLIKNWLGLPSTWPQPRIVLSNLLNLPLAIFIRSPLDAVRRLGQLPLLDVFSDAMVILGVYAFRHQFTLDRAKQLAGVIVAGSLLIGLGGFVNLPLILPFTYFLIAAGLSLLLQRWLTVFPRNPAAGQIAVGILSLSVTVVVFFHLNHYFIAWPKAPETRQAFSSLGGIQ